MNRPGRFPGGVTDRLDLIGDLLRRFRGLGRQRLHFACHHGKALACHAGSRGFDRRVQGQEVGLCGDILNEPHHLADLLCRVQQPLDHRIGAVGLSNGALCYRCRVNNLTGDFLPRCRKFLRRGSHGLHIRGGLLRGCGDGGALPRRLLRDCGQRLRRALHFGGC